MASNFLAHVTPPEVLLEILSYADNFSDNMSFALTCRNMYQAWLTKVAGLLEAWELLERDIPAAQLALLAHRAGQAFGEAERDPQKLPVISLQYLSSFKRPVSAAEIVGVKHMHLLARALEHSFCTSGFALQDGLRGMRAPETPDRMAEWRLGMHKAIYRSLITGAALAGVYKEPYLELGSRPELILEQNDYTGPQHDEFLETFPLLRNSTTEEELEKAFGSYSEWLLKSLMTDKDANTIMEQRFETCSGRAQSCHHRQSYELPENRILLRPGCPLELTAGGSHAQAHAVALELMRLLWASTNIFDALKPRTKGALSEDENICIGPIAPYGYFTSFMVRVPSEHKIQYPALINLEPLGGISSDINGYDWDWIQSRFLYMDDLGHSIYGNDGYFPFIQAKFFVYFARKYLKSAFGPDFFHVPDGAEYDNDWEAFHYSLLIFSLDDVEGRNKTYFDPDGYGGQFAFNGILDGGDLLVSADGLDALIASYM